MKKTIWVDSAFARDTRLSLMAAFGRDRVNKALYDAVYADAIAWTESEIADELAQAIADAGQAESDFWRKEKGGAGIALALTADELRHRIESA